jgi:ankyrin repeat protein
MSNTLLAACTDGILHVVKYMIEEMKINANNDCLTNACEHGHLEVVNYLINEAKLNVNVCDSNHEFPIFSACQSGNFNLIKFLVNNGANLNVKNDLDESVLVYACWECDLEVIKYFVEELNIDISDVEKCTHRFLRYDLTNYFEKLMSNKSLFH